MKKKSVQMKSVADMDARRVAEAVQLANSFTSSLYLEFQNMNVNVKSIMGMMTLGLAKGDQFTLVAEGEDEEEAIRQMQEFFAGEA